MAERVSLGRSWIGNQNVIRQRVAKTLGESVVIQPADDAEELFVNAAAGNSRHPYKRQGTCGQPLNSGAQYVAQRRRQLAACAESRSIKGNKFLGKERIALRASEYAGGELRI